MSAPPYIGEGQHALWHVGENGSIRRFEPRDGLVWAIDTRHLPLYWFPRDCPRVTFWANDDTSDDDVEHWLQGDRLRRVHVIELAWVVPMRDATVYAYRLPEETFELEDASGSRPSPSRRSSAASLAISSRCMPRRVSG